jgi:hypothetical protein
MSNPDVQQDAAAPAPWNDQPERLLPLQQIIQEWQLRMREEMNAAVIRGILRAHRDGMDFENRHGARSHLQQG